MCIYNIYIYISKYNETYIYSDDLIIDDTPLCTISNRDANPSLRDNSAQHGHV